MKATFALLANIAIANFVRELAWEIHRKYRTGTGICRVLPHVSLKQLFEIEDVTRLEAYMREFVQTIRPFKVRCTELQLVPTTIDGIETGILWLDVEETDALRQLHDRLNRELVERFENTQAPFDGLEYHLRDWFSRTCSLSSRCSRTCSARLWWALRRRPARRSRRL